MTEVHAVRLAVRLANGALACLVFLYRCWYVPVLVAIVALEVLVFAPRGMFEALIGGAIVGAGVAVAAVLGSSL
jgi:hypothetical protein